MKIFLRVLLALLGVSLLFPCQGWAKNPFRTDAEKQAIFEAFMNATGFSGGYTYRWGSNDMEYMNGTFADSIFTVKPGKNRYRQIADQMVARLLPVMGIPAGQVRFNCMEKMQSGDVYVKYFEVIGGYEFDRITDGLQLLINDSNKLRIDITNHLTCPDELQLPVKLSKQQAYNIAKTYAKTRAPYHGLTVDKSSCPSAVFQTYEKHIDHKIEVILCWKVTYSGYFVYVDANSGKIIDETFIGWLE